MRNFNLIKTFVSSIMLSFNKDSIITNVCTLVQTLPEEVRENALAILSGTAELTFRPVEQVELISKNPKSRCDVRFDGQPTVDFLNGNVRCEVKYTDVQVRWYASEDEHNYWDWRQSEKYKFPREHRNESSQTTTFLLSEWNTGKVEF